LKNDSLKGNLAMENSNASSSQISATPTMDSLGIHHNNSIISCLVCQSQRHISLYTWEHIPLSVVGLKDTAEEAKKMANLVMNIHRCAYCGHVFNTEFDPKHVDYEESSNLVYNKGYSWESYQEQLANEWIETYDIRNRCVVEVGCGQGLFLARFVNHQNRCIGFEPGIDAQQPHKKGIEIVRDYFNGAQLSTYPADIILCRHVIEHLSNPLDFLQEIALGCQNQKEMLLFLAEVPMIDKALAQIRINDFLYEHVSNFTFHSFRTLFELAGFEILEHKARYDDEVVTIVARPKKSSLITKIHQESRQFQADVVQQYDNVHQTLSQWQNQNKSLALWAATGKGAAFMNMFDLSVKKIAYVVDSDSRKWGKYVPGTGQCIQPPQNLINNPVDKILICSNWHARDIEHEIKEVHHLTAELYVYLKGQIQKLTPEMKL
jgi:2-polyprenyl-3-methyl-5-hydroxy-6-metoxy-1,4-benzoquinol methylase